MKPDLVLSLVAARLEPTPSAIAALLDGVSPQAIRERSPSGAWSILEIVNHLADEDADDFRFRLKSMLDDPTRPWPLSNPEAWATEREYQQRDLAESLDRFAKERAESIRWLRSLRGPDWKTAYMHPSRGPVYAGELLAAWPAHDALHIRQIAKRLYELAAREGAAAGFNVEYAGPWGA